MNAPAQRKPSAKGFTLVEMLVVIVIIGILAGMTAAVLGPARAAARRAVVTAELKQLDMALENYKSEYGEYPPSFVDINIVAERGGDPIVQQDARDAVARHLRKAFPRYIPGRQRSGWTDPNPDTRPDVTPFDKFANDVYYSYGRTIDPAQSDSSQPLKSFDAASSLVFWLGGLPETVPAAGGSWIPAGFNSDPQMPFKPGGPRTEPLFKFVPDRLVVQETHYISSTKTTFRYLHYYPDKIEAPYVYFKSHRRRGVWQYGAIDSTGAFSPYWYHHALEPASQNFCVPYRDRQDPPFWREAEKYQIITAGLDGQFGTTPPIDTRPGGGALYRLTKVPICRSAAGDVPWSEFEYDNLTNFCKGTLEDEIE
jgi:prepilin-type N-terminal cleavage/methylation domain-containing protein